MRAHTQQYARSERHKQLAKVSLDEIFDLTAGVHCYFYYIGNRSPYQWDRMEDGVQVLLYVQSDVMFTCTGR